MADPQPPAPLAAIMNYGAVTGLPAIANGIAVPLCNPAATSCTLGDLRLQADTSGTDILGDVVGYFVAAIESATQNFVDLTTAQIVGGDKTLTGNLVLGASTGSTGNIMKGPPWAFRRTSRLEICRMRRRSARGPLSTPATRFALATASSQSSKGRWPIPLLRTGPEKNSSRNRSTL